MIEYVSLEEYLEKLEFISKAIAKNNRKSVSYMCAAVSDFYLTAD